MEVQTRKATWLELFYDLVFVVAIAKAVHTLGHVHDGHIAADTYGKYVLIMVPLWWAWTGHTLFSNRFDTDDTLQRLMTLAQMACAASMALFISTDFEPNYRGFLLSYVIARATCFNVLACLCDIEEGRDSGSLSRPRIHVRSAHQSFVAIFRYPVELRGYVRRHLRRHIDAAIST